MIPGFIIVAGLQGGGKSYFIKWFMHTYRKKFDWGVVFTNTGFAGDNFDYVPCQYVHAKYDDKALIALKNLHERLIKEGKSPSAFVIFDDCLFGKQWNDENFKTLITQLRHYRITCIISCQYPQSVTPLFRTNAFQVVMFYMGSEPALKALYNSYGQMFNNYSAFKKYLIENTGDHQFLWYDARNGATTLEGRYKVMKCPAELPKFMLKYTKKI